MTRLPYTRRFATREPETTPTAEVPRVGRRRPYRRIEPARWDAQLAEASRARGAR